METIKIDRKIPLPKARETYPFSEMEVGDSIKTQRNIASTAYSWSQNNKNGKVKFITRKEGKGFRLWRIE